jgi:hypothetical protein
MKKVSLHWTPLQRILLFLPATLHNFDESQSPRWSILSAGDVVGFVLAWFSLLPVFILVGLGTLILVRRDLQTMFFTGGLVANEGVNFILKHLIQEPRPINGCFLQNPLRRHYITYSSIQRSTHDHCLESMECRRATPSLWDGLRPISLSSSSSS